MNNLVHPRWERALELAMFFQTISLAVPEAVVDMDEYRVPEGEGNLCGTPACHAGWFGAFIDASDSFYGEAPTDFTSSRQEVARHLGFYAHTLAFWAKENPEIWGNEFGDKLFYEDTAFIGHDNTRVTLGDISNKWFEVAERLYNMQELGESV